mmetsp:Transcript_18083/g.27353  ORF Transcript_18083/g.27353 Transcript_18083/m.27353 type:complete len:779 (+) Transcript_18083:97-2433(+)|eukprot:CAMPEP_0194212750 /NCGR_PEP_ID=MMETSP0156-20130528/12792_1 /TAXON_ID=33649 /ORGANISM="Thalassionema nitzschioides, Strain L26-B" /LENGTH=778 /DNA_ID=CAMNT_0038940629 /DNA_START=1 /DNA_END=2337 /DNA_ORIENTATION=+
MPEEVIELSIEETNKLRAELGLAPLRTNDDNRATVPSASTANTSTDEKECLELSVEETNALREKIGLKPLNNVKKEALHKPAPNEGDTQQLKERIEREKLKRDVKRGADTTFGKKTLAEDEENVLSWAEKMRKSEKTSAISTEKKDGQVDDKKKKKQKKKNRKRKELGTMRNYDEEDLQGVNVAHAVSDFEAGSTTILTLADTSILDINEQNKVVGINEVEEQLENSALADQQTQKDRLREKRKLEMGMGRAGGYAGFDDDEFEELGGVQGPSRAARGSGELSEKTKQKRRGFQIGGDNKEEEEMKDGIFAHLKGKAISLEPSLRDTTMSDFLTTAEDAVSNKKKKKDAKFKKKKKKKDTKKNHRKTAMNDEDDDEEALQSQRADIVKELEESAVNADNRKKRKRRNDDDNDEAGRNKDEVGSGSAIPPIDDPMDTTDDNMKRRRKKFEEVMEKGNQETAAVFKQNPVKVELASSEVVLDEEPDDEFLNEALAKARRMRKIRETAVNRGGLKGADAVAQALLQSKDNEKPDVTASDAGVVQFAVDETREFTRALRARSEQAERQKAKRKVKIEMAKKEDSEKVSVNNEELSGQENTTGIKTEDLKELAKQVQDDDPDFVGIDGTANTAPIGRGMAGILSMLRHTGEISGRNAGREELRGRAKDERTYEDYEALDLSKVVRVGEGASEKDKEFASRQIKLDYRDEHGRLLTRKEAYRNLCYMFHGHGSSAKNEERRLRQIEREQAEARLASHQASGAGSLGALRATQKATGKAFVVHKT